MQNNKTGHGPAPYSGVTRATRMGPSEVVRFSVVVVMAPSKKGWARF